jgi:hypothetical protein
VTDEESMSHHSRDRDIDIEYDNAFRRMLEPADKLGKTGEHPRGRLTPTDEGAIRIAVGSKNGAVVIDFGTPVAWIGFSPQEARDVAASIVKHADSLEGK